MMQTQQGRQEVMMTMMLMTGIPLVVGLTQKKTSVDGCCHVNIKADDVIYHSNRRKPCDPVTEVAPEKTC